MKKIFFNRSSNKEWWIEIDEGNIIRTCLNNGKIKEIICDDDFKTKSKASSLIIGQLSKGFSYYNPLAEFGEIQSYQFVGRDYNGFLPLATSKTDNTFYVVRIQGKFEDEIFFHFDCEGNILNKIHLGANRMTYKQVLCANDTILLNNSYLIESLSLETKILSSFANKTNSMLNMLDSKGDLALWYTGEEIIVFNFNNNKVIWNKIIKCEKCEEYYRHYYCDGFISPNQSKIAYRTSKDGYVIVDLKSNDEIRIDNSGWHPFFSPDDKYFSVGGKVYLCDTGEDIDNPFPFKLKQGISYFDIWDIRIYKNLIALRRLGEGYNTIEIYDYEKMQLLLSIQDIFTIKQCSFDFTENSFVIHSDYGVVSVYSLCNQEKNE